MHGKEGYYSNPITIGLIVYSKISGRNLGVVEAIEPNPYHPSRAISVKIDTGKMSYYVLKNVYTKNETHVEEPQVREEQRVFETG